MPLRFGRHPACRGREASVVDTIVTQDIELAASILRSGGLVAFPTETVYGLAADAMNSQAVRRIFAAKGRPADNPLIVHVAKPEEAGSMAVINDLAADLIERFWPGPLTLVLPARDGVTHEARAGLPTVAVRCPDHRMARDLIRWAGRPLAAPSANLSGRPSPTTASAVLDDLEGSIDAVLDGGPCRLGLESTVVDCTGAGPRILRLGALAAEELGLAPRATPEGAQRSPGARYRHYAPLIPLYLVDNLSEGMREHPGAAVLCGAVEAGSLGLVPGPAVHIWTETAPGRAAELYCVLRRLEHSGRDSIVAASLPAQGLDAATMDRLRRASVCPEESLPSAGIHTR